MEVCSYVKTNEKGSTYIGEGSIYSSKLLLIGDGKVFAFENKIQIGGDLGERLTIIENLID